MLILLQDSPRMFVQRQRHSHQCQSPQCPAAKMLHAEIRYDFLKSELEHSPGKMLHK
uniref:Uncharacterized protein n=1 Tax=Anguilla anguilla TaxID=7936 RepID=A0A0E9WPI3_ANGAN